MEEPPLCTGGWHEKNRPSVPGSGTKRTVPPYREWDEENRPSVPDGGSVLDGGEPVQPFDPAEAHCQAGQQADQDAGGAGQEC